MTQQFWCEIPYHFYFLVPPLNRPLNFLFHILFPDCLYIPPPCGSGGRGSSLSFCHSSWQYYVNKFILLQSLSSSSMTSTIRQQTNGQSYLEDGPAERKSGWQSNTEEKNHTSTKTWADDSDWENSKWFALKWTERLHEKETKSTAETQTELHTVKKN